MTKKLHALEIFALCAIPYEKRIERIIYMVREGKLGGLDYRCRKIDFRELVDRLGEPRGKKGQMANDLRRERGRQNSLRWNRRRAKESDGAVHVDDYDPTGYSKTWQKEIHGTVRRTIKRNRITAILLKRFKLLPAESYKDEDGNWQYTETIIPAVGCPRYAFNLRFTPTMEVLDARFGEVPMFLHRPRCYTTKHAHHWTHNHQFIIYKVGDADPVAVRVDGRVTRLNAAIESLKAGPVKAAEKKGYEVRIDWANERFLIKSPRRRKGREVPFKSWTRGKAKA